MNACREAMEHAHMEAVAERGPTEMAYTAGEKVSSCLFLLELDETGTGDSYFSHVVSKPVLYKFAPSFSLYRCIHRSAR